MYAELKRLEQQIAYDAEEVELKHQLAWAKVHISEKESAALLQRIAKKNEVMTMKLLTLSGEGNGGGMVPNVLSCLSLET